MNRDNNVKRIAAVSKPRIKPTVHSDEMIDEIRRLWQSGKHTVQEIANGISVSKNTISGIIHRHRKSEGEKAWRLVPRGRTVTFIPEVAEDSTVVRSRKKKKRPPILGQRQTGKQVAPSMPEIEIIGTTIRWIDRTAIQCAYIEDDPKEASDIKVLQCCGRPVAYMGTWCEYHRDRVYAQKPIKGLDQKRRVAVSALDHGGHRGT